MVPRRREGGVPADSTHSAARRTGCSGPAAAAKEELAALHDQIRVATRALDSSDEIVESDELRQIER